MKHNKNRLVTRLAALLLLTLTVLSLSSCSSFDPDAAIDLAEVVTVEIEGKTNTTLFYFYYNSEETPIDQYGVIQVEIDYYRDYNTTMKRPKFTLTVPDDIQHTDAGQPYFVVTLEDILDEEEGYITSVTVQANDKDNGSSRSWARVVAIIVAVVLLVVLTSTYATCCAVYDSNSTEASLVWIGSMILFIIASLALAAWASGMGRIIMASAGIYFLITLVPYFKYKL